MFAVLCLWKRRKVVKIMSKEIIAKASEIIKSKSTEGTHIGAGVALTLIDSDGYPTTSCVSISKAKGISEIMLGISLASNRAKRVKDCVRASICLFDDDYEGKSYYNITLVGDVEIVTDPKIKQEVWHEMYGEHFEGGVNNSDFAVLRFTTRRYNLWVDMGDELKGSFDTEQKPSVPRLEPILIYNNGQCAKAMELYQKAFGAEVTDVTLYSEADQKDVGTINEYDKELIMNAQMRIGKQTILLCDDNKNSTKIGNHLQMVLEFDTDDEVKSVYNALADGATDLLPPHSATYSSCVAGLTDAYGIPWQLMVWHGY